MTITVEAAYITFGPKETVTYILQKITKSKFEISYNYRSIIVLRRIVIKSNLILHQLTLLNLLFIFSLLIVEMNKKLNIKSTSTYFRFKSTGYLKCKCNLNVQFLLLKHLQSGNVSS